MAFIPFIFDNSISHEKLKIAQAKIGGVFNVKKDKQNKKSSATEVEKKTGYGDKKLEGQNRPAE